MVEVQIIKNRIIEVLKRRGPSLPIQIAGEIKQNSIFTSAFLSELADEKKIKTSALMVGGSHLYLLDGQEDQLEKFTKYLHPKEAEAFLLLKNNKILKESEQEPAIRVALREIKDFAKNFKNDNDVYWKLILTSNSEIESLFQQKSSKQEMVEEKAEKKEERTEISKQEKTANVQPFNLQKSEFTIQEKITEIQEKIEQELTVKEEQNPEKIKKGQSSFLQKNEFTVRKIKRPKEIEIMFDNPLVQKIEKPKKDKPKSEFVLNVIKSLEKISFKIIEEKEHKLKEYLALVEVNSPLGPIIFLTQAKDKQTINDLDLQKLLSDAQSIPLPALMLYTGNLTKKSIEYAEKYSSILKIKKIE